ncbi:MAG: hypothetical protein A2206_00030 [Candidatus Magasanikbacteria bacterium RIFOXYA1_FULL_40_8]|uniref:Uncharacterized protein n=1 Tax=Candidatus Magasanikbacteria bacterium RIFOXYA1_FULL_40_8 TaxID=1798694 RepID=A0A1F6NU42_9BACT|nr:MAG: hypothetical protein A2224_01120 [Candidatus Magasanikbacteria bacterium RIFOXYA2_FULL_40_20]OGH87378.1 MAG: hypothetical protein A2206_00030 [Candidatus Magasanikbacteria bacterium RIFOXYA1_FULL_40_8]
MQTFLKNINLKYYFLIVVFFGVFFLVNPAGAQTQTGTGYCDCDANFYLSLNFEYYSGTEDINCPPFPVFEATEQKIYSTNTFGRSIIRRDFSKLAYELRDKIANTCSVPVVIGTLTGIEFFEETPLPEEDFVMNENYCNMLKKTSASFHPDTMQQALNYYLKCEWVKTFQEDSVLLSTDTCKDGESMEKACEAFRGEEKTKCVQKIKANCEQINVFKEAFRELNQLNIKSDSNSIQVFIGRIIKYVLGFTGSLTLAMFVMAGLIWMTARGNSERTAKALKIMTWASLGTVVILSSYVILDFIFDIFG